MSGEHEACDPMLLWPRIRQAIYAATVCRTETMLHLPTCHRKGCPGSPAHNSDDVDLVFRMFADRIAESVYNELLCEAVSNPELAEGVSR